MIKYIISNFRQQVKLILISTIVCLSINIQANERFKSDYPCEDGVKQCLSSGTREIEGQQVHRDCWEWAYEKTCQYPSKDNCGQYAHCYSLGQRECLLRDSAGNCVNVVKEFSCKRWEPTYVESETIRYGTEDKQGTKSLICNDSVPCLDGNCFNKRYSMDSDMGHTIAALSGLAQGKNIDGFQIWKGTDLHCSKKKAGYSNCCKISPNGWGKQLGTKCSKDEKILAKKRQKNLCVYIGKKKVKKLKVVVAVKHYYCCFSNILERIIQVQGRAQLNKGFGNQDSPQCQGLTLEELDQINFEKIDFSEFEAEIHRRLVMPNTDDVEQRVKSSIGVQQQENAGNR